MDINKLIEEIARELANEMSKKGSSGDSCNSASYDASYAKYCDHTVLKPEHRENSCFCVRLKNMDLLRLCQSHACSICIRAA